jgi:hypothetical protein
MNTPCMGGWCAHRQRCALYHLRGYAQPHERLCTPGIADQFVALPLMPSRAPGPANGQNGA